MSRLRRYAETIRRHPASAAVLARLGVDVAAIMAEERAERPRRAINAHSDGPGDEAPHRRDYGQFERDRT